MLRFKFVTTQVLVLWDENTTVPHSSLTERVHRLLNSFLAHGELHENRLNLMLGGELKHLTVDVAGSNNGALNADTVQKKRHVGNFEHVVRDSEREDLAVRGHVAPDLR